MVRDWRRLLAVAAVGAEAATADYTYTQIHASAECCRSNGAQVGSCKTVSPRPEDCEDECSKTDKCNYFSHSLRWMNCVLCSACDLTTADNSAAYTAWEKRINKASQLSARQQQLEFFLEVFDAVKQGGCSDAESLLPVLKVSLERGARRAFLVDVGANRGDTAAAMLAVFGQRMMSIPDGAACPDVNRPPRIIAFEPNPEAFAALRQRFIGDSIHLVQAALNLLPGNKTFYYKAGLDGADTLGSFVVWGTEKNLSSTRVRGFTLDSFFQPRQRIHLLKVDAEGYDGAVLFGAQEMLLGRRIKFLVFEYSWTWRDLGPRGSSLKFVVGWLFERGYTCFFITATVLVPISGTWWQDRYESHTWMNVFCGHRRDPDLFDAYVAYGTNRHTLSFALENLAAWKDPSTEFDRF